MVGTVRSVSLVSGNDNVDVVGTGDDSAELSST